MCNISFLRIELASRQDRESKNIKLIFKFHFRKFQQNFPKHFQEPIHNKAAY